MPTEIKATHKPRLPENSFDVVAYVLKLACIFKSKNELEIYET